VVVVVLAFVAAVVADVVVLVDDVEKSLQIEKGAMLFQ